MASAGAELRNLVNLEGIAACSVGALVVNVWDRHARVSDALAVGELFRATAKEHPWLHLLCVLGAGSTVPEPAVRDALLREVKRVQPQLGSVTNVLEGAGLGAAALRAAVTGMTLFLRPTYPVKTYASLPEAVDFAARQSKLEASLVARAVAELRGAGLGV